MLVAVVGVAALTVACAKEPTPEIQGAQAALQALSPEVGEYAPEALSAAQDAQAALNAELKVQQDKFALFRSYEKTKELAAAAQTAAEHAATAAEAEKEKVHTEATAMLSELQTGIEEVKTLLAQAPKGKGTQADLAALSADLSQVEASAGEAEADLGAGKYRDAKAKLEAAKQTAERIKADITAAIEAKNAAKARRG